MSGHYQPGCESLALNPRQIAAAEGQPKVQGKILYVSDDKKITHGVWESTPGTFTMTFTNDDSGLVLSGEAIAHFDNGTSWRLGPGAIYTFKAGTRIRLEITKTWRKVFFNYYPEGTTLTAGT